MDVTAEDFAERLRDAVEMHDAAALREVAQDIGVLGISRGALEDEAFAEVVRQLASPRFREMDGGYPLLQQIEADWLGFSPAQRRELLAAIGDAFPHLADWMSCFVASELIGSRADEQALAMLLRIRAASGETGRSFVPHGLEHVAAGAQDARLRERALAELRAMERDESHQVRDEVDASYARLLARGIHLPADVERRVRANFRIPPQKP